MLRLLWGRGLERFLLCLPLRVRESPNRADSPVSAVGPAVEAELLAQVSLGVTEPSAVQGTAAGTTQA